MSRAKTKGKCKVGGEVNRWLDDKGRCSSCAFKLDSADKKAESVVGIRRDMEKAGIPVNVQYKRKGWYDDEY